MIYTWYHHLPCGGEGKGDTFTDIDTEKNTLNKEIDLIETEFQLIQTRSNIVKYELSHRLDMKNNMKTSSHFFHHKTTALILLIAP